jgi:DNA repair ATPase RecN
VRRVPGILAAFLLVGLVAAVQLRADDPAALTQEEEDQVREAQDPSDRIVIYLQLAGARLERFNAIRLAPADARDRAGKGATLDQVLSEYAALDDELKNWIQDQYDTAHDMRKGLRALIDQAPKQLAGLNAAQENPDRYFSDYRESLRDAIKDLQDTIDGATQALADQEKKFGEMKREEKVDAKAAKDAAQVEKKRQKEEHKLHKKETKQGIPEDEDQQN